MTPKTSIASVHDGLAGYTLGQPAPANPFDFTTDNIGQPFSTNVVDTNFTAPVDGVVTAVLLRVRNDNPVSAQFSFTVGPTPQGAFSNSPIPAGADGVVRWVFDTPIPVISGQAIAVNPLNGNGFAVYSSTLPAGSTPSTFNFGSTLPVASGIEYQ